MQPPAPVAPRGATFDPGRRRTLQRVAATVSAPAWLGACSGGAAAPPAGIRVLQTPRGGSVPAARYDAAHDRLHVLFMDRQDVFHVDSGDGGATFGEPVRVNDRPQFANGGLFRGPELALGEDGALHAIWYSLAWQIKGDNKSQQGVMYTRRAPGQAFEPSRNLGGEPSDGYSIAVRGRQVALAWHNGEQLKVRRSDDAGQAFAPATAIDALPCDCCATALQITPLGDALVLFRDRASDRRDMYLATVAHGASAQRKLKLDAHSWVINACPISGSSLAWRSGGATLAWERDGRILLSRVDLAAWRRLEPIDVGAGKYPFVLDNGSLMLVAWVDGKRLQWRRFHADDLKPHDSGWIARQALDHAAGTVARAGEFVLVV